MWNTEKNHLKMLYLVLILKIVYSKGCTLKGDNNNKINFYFFQFQGAGYFIPWWSMSCIYQQSFQVFTTKLKNIYIVCF